MLKTIRKTASGVGAYIIVGLFILAFAVVGVPALNNFGGTAALEVGNRSFSPQAVETELGRRMESYRNRTGQVLTREDAVAQGLLDQATQYLTARGLFEEEAGALNLAVTDKMIQDYLQSNPQLQNAETGRFDRTILDRLLQINRMSLNEFKSAIRAELLQTQVDDAIALNTPAPQLITDYFILRQTEERTVSVATLPAPTFEEPTDEDMQSFYATNADRYALPERRQYVMVALDQDTLKDRVVVTNEEVQQAFDARKAQLGTPETRSFEQAQFATLEAANAVVEAIEGGQSFADALLAAGSEPVTITDQQKSALADSAVADAIFSAEEPGVVGPVDGTFGVVLAKLSSITPGTEVTFEEMEETIRASLFEEFFRDEVEELFDELQEAGDTGATLAQVASDMELPLRTVGPVDRNFLTAEGAIEDGVPLEVNIAAFNLAEGALFEAVDLNDGGYAFLEVGEVFPSTTQPYEEVVDKVRTDFEEDARANAIDTLKAEFTATVASGIPFAEAATQFGGEATAQTLSAFSPATDLPRPFFNDIFSADIGKVVAAPASSEGGLQVAVTEAMSFGPNSQQALITDQLRATLGQRLAQEQYEAYLQAMQEAHPVKRNDAVIATRLGLGQ
ncbi:MAG: SurA N-terminal domain-containing protein [Pseudomonadota bacterium]